jgi:hypothetical protein
MNLQVPKLRRISRLDEQLLTSKERLHSMKNLYFNLASASVSSPLFVRVSSGWPMKWKEEIVSYFNELSEHLLRGTEGNNEMCQIGKQATDTEAPEYLWVLSLHRSVSEVNLLVL